MPAEHARPVRLILMLMLLCVTALAGCQLPPLGNRTPSTALGAEDALATPLGHAVASELAAHPGLTGIDPLADPLDAFAVRMKLIQTAQRTLDVEYYIWRDDLTGTLMLEALREAADRGVRVRLLLDDNGIPSALDPTLAALNAHPNVQVRLFNPFVVRKPKLLNFLWDFSRLNRRMHNKSLTADSMATIVGGRNIGDEYFAAKDGVVFADLDVLAIGPAATDVAHDFDRYWASASAWPANRILDAPPPHELEALDRAAQSVEHNPAAAAYMESIAQTTDVSRLMDGTLPLEWAKTRLVSDDPVKAKGKAARNSLVITQLRTILGDPKRELDLVSPYFVPGAAGTRYLTGLAQNGVAVRILTNSLEATDVLPVHAGYARRREALLEGGVHLYELRRAAGVTDGKNGGKEKLGRVFGASGSSLHAKTFAVDGQRVFVGSLNFDPRSMHLNTELGLVIDSPELAQRIESTFWTQVPQLAYEVRLKPDGSLYWIKRIGNTTVRYDTEPNTTWATRLGVWFFSILPIEWML